MGSFLGEHSKTHKKATLVLGGGSARGVAHIGVLKVLERERIEIERIVGTSMGALIGASYAVGTPIDKLEEKAYSFVMNQLLDPTIPRMGLLAGEKLEATIKEIIDNKNFEDCRMPVSIVTTDIENDIEVVYEKGDMAKIIRASCSWPGIFNPVRIDGRLLVDGGIKNSVPTKIAKTFNPDYTIAVDVGFCVRHGRIENILQMLLQSFQIMGHELNKYQANEADVVINVELNELDQTAFNRSREAVYEGMRSAEAMVGQIKKDMAIA